MPKGRICYPGCQLTHPCSHCGEDLPCSMYYRRIPGSGEAGRDRGGERSYICRPCAKVARSRYRKAQREADPTHGRSVELRQKYGLSIEQFDTMLAAQGGVCAICDKTEPGGRWGTWHVDHDHGCCPGSRSCGGCIRGLLCHSCNTALGHLADSPILMRKAADYVERQVCKQLPDQEPSDLRGVLAV